MQKLIVRKDVQLFAAGEKFPPQSCWLIIRGAVKTYSWTEDKKMITLGYWGVKDIVGQPLSNLNPYHMDCLTCVEAISIPLDNLSQFSEGIISHAQKVTTLMCIVQTKRVSERLILLLEWLADKFGRPVVDGILIDLRLTHQEIADTIGTNRVTITRLINQFEREGIISRPRNHYLVLKY